ncbi:MAG: BrnA antitoxin family protein [Gallionella sp.]
MSASRKEQVSVRYSPEVLNYFRSTGEGWQTHIDAALRLLVTKHPDWLEKLS